MNAPSERHRRAWLRVMASFQQECLGEREAFKKARKRAQAPAHHPGLEASVWAYDQLLTALQAIPVPEVRKDDTVGQDPLPFPGQADPFKGARVIGRSE